MRRPTALLMVLVLAAAALVAGCGNNQSNAKDARQTLTEGVVKGPYLFNYAGAKQALAKDGIAIRDKGPSKLDEKALPRPQSARQYVTEGGTPFALLLFQSGDTANDALESVDGHVDGEVVVGANFLGVIQAKGTDTEKLRTSLESLGSNPPGPEPGAPVNP